MILSFYRTENGRFGGLDSSCEALGGEHDDEPTPDSDHHGGAGRAGSHGVPSE